MRRVSAGEEPCAGGSSASARMHVEWRTEAAKPRDRCCLVAMLCAFGSTARGSDPVDGRRLELGKPGSLVDPGGRGSGGVGMGLGSPRPGLASRQGASATASLRLASADKANARIDPNQGGLCVFAEGRDKVKAGTAAPTALPSGARNAGNGYLAPSWTARWETSRLASTQRNEPVAPAEG